MLPINKNKLKMLKKAQNGEEYERFKRIITYRHRTCNKN